MTLAITEAQVDSEGFETVAEDLEIMSRDVMVPYGGTTVIGMSSHVTCNTCYCNSYPMTIFYYLTIFPNPGERPSSQC